MATKSSSNSRLEFRLPSKWRSEIERAAQLQNRTLTEFATSVLTEAARKIISEEDQRAHLVLSIRDRNRFLAMLDADPAPNHALLDAARRHRQHIV